MAKPRDTSSEEPQPVQSVFIHSTNQQPSHRCSVHITHASRSEEARQVPTRLLLHLLGDLSGKQLSEPEGREGQSI